MERIHPTSGPVTAAEKANLEKSLSELAAGKTVYPILKAYDWPAKALSVSEPFFGKDKPPVPVVAYGYDTTNNYVFITKQELGRRPLDDLRKQALANLAKVQVRWDRLNDSVLTGSGNAFSAEKILDEKFLLEAEKLLSTDTVYVAIPRRRVIYAANAKASQAKLDEFFHVVGYTLNDDSYGNALITPVVFEFQGTKLSGAKLVHNAPR